MILLGNISIAVEKEGDIFRAYAYNDKEENIAICKCTREGGAVAGLFHNLKNEAIARIEK